MSFSELVRQTLSLTKIQISYRRPSIVVVLLVLGALLVLLGLKVDPDEAEMYGKIGGVLAAFGGVALGIFGWGVEASERRVQLQVTLPTSRVAVSASRFLASALLQLIVAITVLLVLQLPVLSGSGSFGQGWFTTVCASLWGLVMVYISFLGEEVNVALSRSKIALYAVNALILVLALFIASSYSTFDFVSWGSASAAGGSALVLAVLGTYLFTRRSDLGIGVSPWHGLPVDLSKTD